MPEMVGWLKVRFSKEEVQEFNSKWPCSPLSDERAYWFEFDHTGDLIDTDVPEHSDGPAAEALAQDAKEWLTDNGYLGNKT